MIRKVGLFVSLVTALVDRRQATTPGSNTGNAVDQLQATPPELNIDNIEFRIVAWPRAGNPGHDFSKTDFTEASILAPRPVC